jgi:hypothetical protein
MEKIKLKSCLAIMVFVVFSACSTSNPEISVGSNDKNADFLNFQEGKTVLDCGMSCSGSWGWIRDELQMYYHTNRWENLANKVLRNGHNVDLNYYYLGVAAEGLGYKKAAITYFKSAIHASHTCVYALGNNCDGIDVPKIAATKLEAIEKKPRKTKATERQPSLKNAKVSTPSKSAGDKETSKSSSGTTKMPNASNSAKQYSWNQLNKKLVASRMKDPNAVKFENVFFSDKYGSPATCGSVNGKNSFGAYMGFERFIGLGSSMGPFLESDVSDFDGLWRQICR